MADLKRQQLLPERLVEQTCCIQDACLEAARHKLLGKSWDAWRGSPGSGSAVVFGGFVRGGLVRFGYGRSVVEVEIAGLAEM